MKFYNRYKTGVISVIIFLVGFIPNIVSASCDASTKVRYMNLAKNITTSYDYIEFNGQVIFGITLSNLIPDLTIKDVTHNESHYLPQNEISMTGFLPNQSHKFEVYARDCSGIIYTVYVNLPGYNPFYKDPVCNGSSSGLCEKWVNMPYDYENFKKEIQKEKDEKERKNSSVNGENIKGFYDYLLEYFVKYYYIVLPIIIVSCLIEIYHLHKKSELL